MPPSLDAIADVWRLHGARPRKALPEPWSVKRLVACNTGPQIVRDRPAIATSPVKAVSKNRVTPSAQSLIRDSTFP
jgi:hypothetical protein